MGIVVFITVYPFWYQLIISLDSSPSVRGSGLRLWPDMPSFIAYSVIFEYKPLWTGFTNSAMRVVLGVTFTLFMTMLTAYPLSKKDLPFRKAYTTFLFITMLIGGGLIPNYLLMRYLNLTNTIWVLVVPGMMGAYNVFVVRNFYMTLPESLEESAMIDGAGWITIWVRLVLPLSTPVMAVIALWSAVGHWNAWFDVMIYIMDADKITLPIVLRRLLVDSTSSEFQKFTKMSRGDTALQGKSVESAILIVAIIPMLVLYPYLQKYFVKGIRVGSIKE